MLTRLYIDNFRCFVNFEYRPARKQLILGANGAGKSSLLDALLFVRQFAVKGDKAEDSTILNQRTRWMDQPQQAFELEAFLDGGRYVEAGRGQILLISHHPEFINQWAPNYGVQFVRDGIGPVRIKEFHGEHDSLLSSAELVARGWENG